MMYSSQYKFTNEELINKLYQKFPKKLGKTSVVRMPEIFCKKPNNTLLTTSNPEVIIENTGTNMILTLKDCDSQYSNVMTQINLSTGNNNLVVEIDPKSKNKSIADVKNAIQTIKRNSKTIRLVYIGNLPFMGGHEKLWMIILEILLNAGFDEIHMIIPAKGLPGIASEHKMKKFWMNCIDYIKAVHFIRPERWIDNDQQINQLLCQVVIDKQHDGPINVYDEFNFLYSTPSLNKFGSPNCIVPIEDWPSFESFLNKINNSVNLDYFGKAEYRKVLSVQASEPNTRGMKKQTDNNSVINIDANNNLILGTTNEIAKESGNKEILFWADNDFTGKKWVTDKTLGMPNYGYVFFKNPNYKVVNLKQFLDTSWGKFYSVVVNSFNDRWRAHANTLMFVSCFDHSKKFTEKTLDKLHGPALTAIKNNVLDRYKVLYDK